MSGVECTCGADKGVCADCMEAEVTTLRVQLATVKEKTQQLITRHVVALKDARTAGARAANMVLGRALDALKREKEARLQDNADLTDQILTVEAQLAAAQRAKEEAEKDLTQACEDAERLAEAVVEAHIIDGHSCNCPACVTARRVLGR